MTAITPEESSRQTRPLIERTKAYSFPFGEDAARRVRGIKTTQRGRIRSGADARWVEFTAEEYVNAQQSAFSWDARIGSGLMSVGVTDAYEGGQGRLVVRKGPLRLKELSGPQVDQGELQRYLAYMSYCPSMLLNNPLLEMTAIRSDTLRVRERSDRTGAFVDVEIEDSGRILVTRAVRPMAIGKRIVMTPWSATSSDFRELEGLRLPYRLEASWAPSSGEFTYIQIDVITFSLVPAA